MEICSWSCRRHHKPQPGLSLMSQQGWESCGNLWQQTENHGKVMKSEVSGFGGRGREMVSRGLASPRDFPSSELQKAHSKGTLELLPRLPEPSCTGIFSAFSTFSLSNTRCAHLVFAGPASGERAVMIWGSDFPQSQSFLWGEEHPEAGLDPTTESLLAEVWRRNAAPFPFSHLLRPWSHVPAFIFPWQRHEISQERIPFPL